MGLKQSKPTHFEYIEKADAAKVAGDNLKALEMLTEAIEILPTYYLGYLRRAEVHRALGNPVAAMGDLDVCVTYRPSDPHVLLARAACFEDLDEYELAAMERARAKVATSELAALGLGPRTSRDEEGGLDGAMDGNAAQKNREVEIRASIAKDYERRKMIEGRRGHYVQSENDKEVVRRRQEFKRQVAALASAPTVDRTRRGGYTMVAPPTKSDH
jgi:tetratricopeptide (TPR) repeat protein